MPESSSPSPKPRLHQILFEDFQTRIRDGVWLPGDRIPSITQLASELKVSAGSVREALRSLQMINMVKIEHGSGVYVTGTRPSVELFGRFETADDATLLALAETRRILEPELAFFAAERGSDQALAEIDALARQMIELAKKGQDFAEIDVLFHQRIAQAAGNPVLYQMVMGVQELLTKLRKSIVLNLNTSLRTVRFHSLISEALRARNASQARLLMQGEMNAMVDDLLASEEIRKTLASY